jgi:hypothetical protein
VGLHEANRVPPVKLKLLLGALVVLFGAAVTVVAWPATGPRSHVPVALQRPLDAKVAAIETGFDRVSVCESTGTTQCVYGCTAHTFDLDPQHATALDQVAVAYAVVSCHDTDSNGLDEAGTDVVALRFTSPPTRSSLPDDATWADVNKVVPPHAAGAAWWYYTSGTFTLRDRLRRFTTL